MSTLPHLLVGLDRRDVVSPQVHPLELVDHRTPRRRLVRAEELEFRSEPEELGGADDVPVLFLVFTQDPLLHRPPDQHCRRRDVPPEDLANVHQLLWHGGLGYGGVKLGLDRVNGGGKIDLWQPGVHGVRHATRERGSEAQASEPNGAPESMAGGGRWAAMVGATVEDPRGGGARGRWSGVVLVVVMVMGDGWWVVGGGWWVVGDE